MDFPAAAEAVLYHETTRCEHAMVSAPHPLAAEAGRDVLAEGGNALEAALAAAVTSAVLCPHMGHLAGDGFWIIREASGRVRHISACGQVAARATPRYYHERGLDRIPTRGPQAILTIPGTVGGWALALEAARAAGGRMSLPRLLERALHHAREGAPARPAMLRLAAAHLDTLHLAPSFCSMFMRPDEAGGELRLLKPGEPLRQPRLADTLDHLARSGLQDFYSGDIGREISADLERIGSPLTRDDLEGYRAQERKALQMLLKAGTLYSAAAPTQGVNFLTLLAVFERLGESRPESFAHVHGLIEATRQALLAGDGRLEDAAPLREGPATPPSPAELERMAGRIDSSRAQPWPARASSGQSLWIGAADSSGLVVSYTQSQQSAFGSGCVMPGTGIVMQNQGSDLSLEPGARSLLHPGREPPHAASPALAQLRNGRVLAFGVTGDDTDMQTQAALFSRHGMFAMPLGQSVARPRWRHALKPEGEPCALEIESGFDDRVLAALRGSGRSVDMLPDIWSMQMGAAGAVALNANGLLEGAHDPRGDGAALGV